MWTSEKLKLYAMELQLPMVSILIPQYCGTPVFYKTLIMRDIVKSGCTKSAENTLKCRNFCTVTKGVALRIEAVTPQRSEEYERIARPEGERPNKNKQMLRQAQHDNQRFPHLESKGQDKTRIIIFEGR